jgi:protein-disulfide isomerase
MEKEKNREGISLPVAILATGIIIAVAIIIVGSNSDNKKSQVGNDQNVQQTVNESEKTVDPSKIRLVDETDNILGSVDAKIKIVEYSDFECYYCGKVHPTIKQILEDYEGQVAWVYRHLPSPYHKNAEFLALASECVADIEGNEAFWKFADVVFAGQIKPDDLSGIENIIETEKETITNCVDEGENLGKIAEQTREAFTAGAEGTPFSVIIGPNDTFISISGAQPINVWKQIIDQMLAI